ncbi:MAG: lysostaphin resistance A-like protein [Lacinutrix venerupis]
MNFKLYKKNWLLSLGLLFLTLGLIALSIFQGNISSESIKTANNVYTIPYWVLILFVIILAPILEEFIFRGVFTKNKKIKWFSLFTVSIFVILSNNIAFQILFVVYLISLIYNNSKRTSFSYNSLIVINSLLFSIAHIDNERLLIIEASISPLFIRFALGLFFIWICINFSIIKSMLFHASWNIIPLVFLSYSIFFPNPKVENFENNDLQVTWHRISKTSSKVNIYPKGQQNSILSESEALFLLKSVEWSKEKNDSIIKNYIPMEPYMSYKFNIKLKDTTNKSKNLHKKIETFLMESKLIEIN